MGVLMAEKNGHRLVLLDHEDAISLEWLDKDSLGADTWKTARTITRMAMRPDGGMVENILYLFLVEMFTGDEGPTRQTNNIQPEYTRKLEEL